jgi:hypothetical protein
MKQTKGNIEGTRSHIDAPKGHKPPKAISDVKPIRDLDGFLPDGETDPAVLKARYEARIDALTKDAKQPKPTIKERAMNALLNQLLAFFRTWLYGRPVYKTVTNAKGEIEFVLNEDGNKIMNVPLTILGRVLQVLGALGLLTSAIWGKTVGEWGELLRGILALVGG